MAILGSIQGDYISEYADGFVREQDDEEMDQHVGVKVNGELGTGVHFSGSHVGHLVDESGPRTSWSPTGALDERKQFVLPAVHSVPFVIDFTQVEHL